MTDPDHNKPVCIVIEISQCPVNGRLQDPVLQPPYPHSGSYDDIGALPLHVAVNDIETLDYVPEITQPASTLQPTSISILIVLILYNSKTFGKSSNSIV